MSKNIVIQEGGVSTTIEGVRKLETDLSGGGTCNWLPEDEIIGVVASIVDTTLTLSGSGVDVQGNTLTI